MKKPTFVFDPKQYGLPDYDELKAYRIWDTHYHGFWTSGDPFKQNEKMEKYVHRMAIERVISVDIGGTLAKPLDPIKYDDAKRKFLENNTDYFSGIIPIDPGFPEKSVQKMVDWIENGPCVGIKYVGGNELGVTCDHRNNDIIIEKAIELNAVVYIHTWIKTGGDPKTLGGGNLSGENEPRNVVALAKRFPDKALICGHAGGDWELGIRTVRPQENVLLEFAGADPQSGGIDLAVRELGIDRLVWGGHGPSRSYSTELAKVLEADLTEEERMKVFGRNYRRMAKPIFGSKGISIYSSFGIQIYNFGKRVIMIRSIQLIMIMTVSLYSCQSDKMPEKENGFLVTLMTIDPGHFHSVLVQKNMYPEVDSIAYVYAPDGDDVKQHLAKIKQYNDRNEKPTHWNEKVYTGSDFADKMFSEKPGNVLVVAGNNQKKTDYILRAVNDSIHVYADKPMAINGKNYEKLKQAFDIADEKGLLVYDIMTQRFDITTILQRKLSTFSTIFGEVAESNPEDPAITQESVHYFSKMVSGSPLIRPAWFFDVEQQGSGIVDITTHLVDLIMWTLFPQQNLHPSDAEIALAKQWSTKFTPAQFEKVTGMDHYPDYLQKAVTKDSILDIYSNGAITFRLKDIYGKVSVSWEYEAPPGGQDTHYSIFRGTKANLVIRQDKTTDFEPVLFVEPIGSFDHTDWSERMEAVMKEIDKDYSKVDFEESENGFKIIIPEKFKVGHEALFTQVTEKYLDYLKAGAMPQWEKDFMLTKYYITTEAYKESLAEQDVYNH